MREFRTFRLYVFFLLLSIKFGGKISLTWKRILISNRYWSESVNSIWWKKKNYFFPYPWFFFFIFFMKFRGRAFFLYNSFILREIHSRMQNSFLPTSVLSVKSSEPLFLQLIHLITDSDLLVQQDWLLGCLLSNIYEPFSLIYQ